jgi:hypothetical protein
MYQDQYTGRSWHDFNQHNVYTRGQEMREMMLMVPGGICKANVMTGLSSPAVTNLRVYTISLKI